MGEAPAGYKRVCEALALGDMRAMARELRNNLAPAACSLCGEVGRAAAWLARQDGVLGSQVTGSGACSFALCESAEDADRIAAAARSCGWRSWSTVTLSSV